jgi:hypothetical protein
MRCLPFLVMMFLLAVPATVPAETYQWTDAAGVKHFTDNSDTIPAKYRNRARALPLVQTEQRGSSALQPEGSVPALSPSSPIEQNALEARRAELGRDLQKLQDGLPAKRTELEQLRRKWTVIKGRTPSAEEIAEFEKKRAKGEAGEKDNPYINRNPLSTPGPAREAYFRKLDEIRTDEALVSQLRKELDALGR